MGSKAVVGGTHASRHGSKRRRMSYRSALVACLVALLGVHAHVASAQSGDAASSSEAATDLQAIRHTEPYHNPQVVEVTGDEVAAYITAAEQIVAQFVASNKADDVDRAESQPGASEALSESTAEHDTVRDAQVESTPAPRETAEPSGEAGTTDGYLWTATARISDTIVAVKRALLPSPSTPAGSAIPEPSGAPEPATADDSSTLAENLASTSEALVTATADAMTPSAPEKERLKPDAFVIINVYARWCYFSAQFASTYSAIARAYPGIPTLALDYGKEHATLNPWIAIAGLPSVLLFKGSHLAGKYSGNRTFEDVCRYITHHSNISADPSVTGLNAADEAAAFEAEPQSLALYYFALCFLFTLAVRKVLSTDRLHSLVTPHLKID